MRDTYQLSHLHGYLQALTVFAVDIGPHMHMDIELVAEALRTYFLSKVRCCWRRFYLVMLTSTVKT